MNKLLGSMISVAILALPFSAEAAQMSAAPLISALPDIGSITPANAAGVLQYCVKHELVSRSATDRVLGPLTTKRDITGSPLYAAGQQGQIVTGGKTFALGQAAGYMQSQACDRVFKQAKHFK